MATASTLIRSGRAVVVRPFTIELAAAIPLTGKVSIRFPPEFSQEKLEEYASQLRLALEQDGGKRYHQILSIWILVTKRLFA